MWENDLTLEAAILTTDLEFFGLDFDNIESGVFLSYKFNSFGHLLPIGHGGRG